MTPHDQDHCRCLVDNRLNIPGDQSSLDDPPEAAEIQPRTRYMQAAAVSVIFPLHDADPFADISHGSFTHPADDDAATAIAAEASRADPADKALQQRPG